MRLLLCLCQGFHRAPSKGKGRGRPLRHNLVQFHGLRPAFWDDDEVDPRRQERWGQTKALPTQSLDPVPHHGAADTPRRDEAQARLPGG
jgi:hypothetical protein